MTTEPSFPTVTISPNASSTIQALISHLQDLSVRIDYAEAILPSVVQISEEIAFCILSKIDLPQDMADFAALTPLIHRFLDEYNHPFIILQLTPKLWNDMDSRVSLGLLGLFIKLYLEEQQGIIPTRHVKDTALCVKSLAKRVQIDDHPPVLARIKPKAKTLFDAQKTLVEGLMLCGPKKSSALCDIFASPLDIFLGIQQSSILYTKSGNPKGVEGEFSDIEGFSSKFILENQELYTANDIPEPTPSFSNINPSKVQKSVKI